MSENYLIFLVFSLLIFCGYSYYYHKQRQKTIRELGGN